MIAHTEPVFNDKAVIVTGASSGIGKAVALQLAGEGAWLALAARNTERLDALVVECERRGGRAVAIPANVAMEGQCQRLIQLAHEAFGRVDMLINNAGMSVVGKLEDLPTLDWRHAIRERDPLECDSRMNPIRSFRRTPPPDDQPIC